MRDGGSLIAVTTEGVRMTDRGANACWVAKAGVERLYAGLAAELRERRIAVNCLAPSKVVRTEGWQAAGGRDLPDDEVEPPEAMAAAVHLARQDAATLTGTVQRSLDLAAGRPDQHGGRVGHARQSGGAAASSSWMYLSTPRRS